MGRPPCCDKVGVKKGPWTPEEDITLVSYIQKHGPGNWRHVPNNTGLLRCSKSCRLRWTNYLRPGIKRGNFTEQEERMIFHLQALLGNRWAAIASYLPQRTDNDIKNYWNTHLKKKYRTAPPPLLGYADDENIEPNSSSSSSKGQWERRLQADIELAKRALREALSIDASTSGSSEPPPPRQPAIDIPAIDFRRPPVQSPASYATSEENISKLLRNWTRNPYPKPAASRFEFAMPQQSSSLSFPPAAGCDCSSSSLSSEEGTTAATALLSTAPANFAQSVGNSDKLNSNNGVIATLPAENWNKNSSINGLGTQMPLAILEKWLLDDAYYSVQPEGINHNHGDELLMEAIGMGTSTDPAPGFF